MTQRSNILNDLFLADFTTPDVAASGTIRNRIWDEIVELVSAAAESRTLAAPFKAGQRISLAMKTDGGDITVTVTDGYNEDGDTVIVFSDAGQFATLESVPTSATAFAWRLVASNFSKFPVSMVAATAITRAQHADRALKFNHATGFAASLPAFTGSGAKYRFFVETAASSGSHTIVATGAYLFGGVLQNNDTVTSGIAGAAVATNAAGSTTITLNGGTTGGRKGDWIEIEDVGTNLGMVTGVLNASGTEATPFS